MHLPPELELKILSYIEPNPIVYTRLATVSRFYYSYFTSDEKWLALDIQDVKTGLFNHYRSLCDLPNLKHCWSDFKDCMLDVTELYTNDIPRFPSECNEEDLLSTLGLLRHHSRELKEELNRSDQRVIDGEHYARVAVGINYRMVGLVEGWVLLRNPDIVEYCVRLDPLCLNWLDADFLVRHKELVLQVLRQEEGYDLKECCLELLSGEPDRDFLWEAAEYQPGLFTVFKEVEADLLVRIKVGFYQRLLKTRSRDELRELFSCSAQDLCSDIELFRAGISAAPTLLKDASETVRDDWETVMRAVERRSTCLVYASPRLLADADFCAAVVNANNGCFNHVPESVKENEQFRSQLTFRFFTSFFFDKVPPSYWDDEAVVLQAMRCDRECFLRASDRVRRSRAFAVEAVTIDGNCFEHLNPNFQNDREIALLAMKSAPSCYRHVPRELRGDKKIAMAAASDWASFRVFSDELKNDKDVVMKMIDSYPQDQGIPIRADFPIQFWSDRDVALKMVQKIPASYFDLTDDLRMDKQILLAAFGDFYGDSDEDSYSDTSSESGSTWVFMRRKAVEDPTFDVNIAWVPEVLRYDLEVARAAISVVPCYYNGLPLEVRRNKEIAELALRASYSKASCRSVDASFLPLELLDDERIMSFAVLNLGTEGFSAASDRLKREPRFVALLFDSFSAVPRSVLDEIPAQVWADRELVLKAARTTPDILALAPLFQEDTEIVAAVRSLTRKDPDPRVDLFPDESASDKHAIIRAIHKNREDRWDWYGTRSFSDPQPDWLDSACKKLRDAVARHYSDDIDVLREYFKHLSCTPGITHRCDILPQLSFNLRDNEEIVMMCIRGGIHGKLLGYASPRLLGDRDFILKAIAPFFTYVVNPPELTTIFPALHDDLDLARQAMHELILHYKNTRTSRPWRMKLLQGVLCVFTSASQRLRESPALIEEFAFLQEVCPYSIAHFLPDDLRDSKVFMMELVRCAPCMFRLATHRLRGDFELLSRAMERDSGNRVYATGTKEEIDERVSRILEYSASTTKPASTKTLASTTKKRRMHSPDGK